MPITIYLTGQNNFGNRGCEALVRSTVATLREQLPDAHFFVPSLDIARDSAQWPEAAEQGVEFVPSPVVPASYRWWGRACRVLPFLKGFRWPSLKGLKHLEEYLQASDAVVSIGGDNYSLDYGLVSLFFFVGIADRARALGKKTALWGASVGPFTADKIVERSLIKHLETLDLVSVRESHSVAYLKNLGLKNNLAEVVDSAFALQRSPVDIKRYWPSETGDGVIGLNVSEVMQISLDKRQKNISVIDETRSFVSHIIENTNYSILLIPHVAPLNGNPFNNDENFLEKIITENTTKNPRIGNIPRGLNCCQLKEIISHCRFFIGGRTHATIAAFSTHVPTISIAYSIKARGINLDLFGHEKYVLPTPDYSEKNLISIFSSIEQDEKTAKEKLEKNINTWKERAHLSAQIFSKIILSTQQH